MVVALNQPPGGTYEYHRAERGEKHRSAGASSPRRYEPGITQASYQDYGNPIAAAVAEDRLQIRGSAVPACGRIRADERIRPALGNDRAD